MSSWCSFYSSRSAELEADSVSPWVFPVENGNSLCMSYYCDESSSWIYLRTGCLQGTVWAWVKMITVLVFTILLSCCRLLNTVFFKTEWLVRIWMGVIEFVKCTVAFLYERKNWYLLIFSHDCTYTASVFSQVFLKCFHQNPDLRVQVASNPQFLLGHPGELMTLSQTLVSWWRGAASSQRIVGFLTKHYMKVKNSWYSAGIFVFLWSFDLTVCHIHCIFNPDMLFAG